MGARSRVSPDTIGAFKGSGLLKSGIRQAMRENTDPKILLARIEQLEKNRLYFQHAMETVLSADCFHGEVKKNIESKAQR